MSTKDLAMWMEFFKEAINGTCTIDEMSAWDVVNFASAVADKALAEYLRKADGI